MRLWKWVFSDDRISSILSLILKTPGLIMLEYWYQNIGLDQSIPKSLSISGIFGAGLNLAVPFEGMILMLLPLDMLVGVYMHIISAMVLFGANTLSQSYVEEEIAIIHNKGMGNTTLYKSHVDFMKDHLYENVDDYENNNYNDGSQEANPTYLHLQGLPLSIASLFKLSPLMKRQIVQAMCYVSLALIIAWCLSLDEEKNDRQKVHKKHGILPFIHFVFKWLPMVYVFPLCARITHAYFNKYLIDIFVEKYDENDIHQLSGLLLEEVLQRSHRISQITVAIGYSIYILSWCPKLFRLVTMVLSVGRIFVAIYGYLHASMVLMKHLIDPAQFVLFWIALLFNQIWNEYFTLTNRNFVMTDGREWYIFLLLVMSEICRSPLTLIASCLAVMALTNGVLKLVLLYLASCKSHAPPSITVQSGLTEGMVMFLLSLQTGLIDMEMPHRLGAMSVILFIVAASLFQTILEVTHPVLLALSASSRHWFHHVKILVLCGIIFFVPAYMSHLLVETVELDLWTMVVISSSLLTSIQVLGHVVHYCLYIYDARRDEPLESLDDVVYYLKSIIHSLELVSALFVVCAGFKEAWTGHWSVLNSVVLAVHCYFNVWLRIKNGWRSFLLRQAAATRIQNLNDASEDDLKSHADVCAICYSEMTISAKVTPCKHIFHGGCLKKWLFVQDHCPMCSSKISEQATSNDLPPQQDAADNEINENGFNVIQENDVNHPAQAEFTDNIMGHTVLNENQNNVAEVEN